MSNHLLRGKIRVEVVNNLTLAARVAGGINNKVEKLSLV